MKLNAKIKSFFEKNGLDLTKSGQTISRRDKVKLAGLKALIPDYEKEKRIFISCVCQSSINDFIAMLQVYYRDNPVKSKVIAENGAD